MHVSLRVKILWISSHRGYLMVRAKAGKDDYVRKTYFWKWPRNCSNRKRTLSKEFSGKLKISLKTANAMKPRARDGIVVSRVRECDIKQSRVIMRHQPSEFRLLRCRKSLHAPLHHSVSCLSMTSRVNRAREGLAEVGGNSHEREANISV